MGKFAFRLQSYLDVKIKLEDQKKLEYGEALAVLENEKIIKKELSDKKEKTILEMKYEINKKIQPDLIKSFKDFQNFIEKKIFLQDEKIEQAEKIVEVKRKELVTVVKEKKMIEKLKEKDFENYLKEETLAEQKVIDEIVSYQYNNKAAK